MTLFILCDSSSEEQILRGIEVGQEFLFLAQFKTNELNFMVVRMLLKSETFTSNIIIVFKKLNL